MIKKKILALLIIFFTTIVMADTGSDYSNAQSYIADQHLSQALNASVLSAKNRLPFVSQNPGQEKYYSNPQSINADAQTSVAASNTVGNIVKSDALTRPKMTVNANSPAVQFSQKIQNNAQAISNGSYKDCNKKVITTNTSVKKTCTTIPASCRVEKTNCLEPSSTKTIDGVSVMASCWKAIETNQCGRAMSSECMALKNRGCTQISSQCKVIQKGACESYLETWDCPVKKVIGTGLQCGERFYCMDGSCQPIKQEVNKAFGKSVTELDAVSSAGEDAKKQGGHPKRDPNSIRIFTGHAAHCRDVVLGALNCCRDRGWAKGIFANCNGEEKTLGHDKEKGGLVVYTGRYCSDRILGICVEHKKGYCIFPSRIAYDVQVGGRLGQLRRGFGDGKSPDCSGLTPDQISQIKFDKIDFSNAVSSVVNKSDIPDGNHFENSIEKKIKAAVEKQSHG